MTHNHTRIENTFEARVAPPRQYRLLLNVFDPNRSGLYHIKDFDRAELALRAADRLHRSKKSGGWCIVHDSKGQTLTVDDGPSQMFTRKSLIKRFGGGKRPGSKRAFTAKHADAIRDLQPERLPGWHRGDRMLVFWSDIAEATGAEARCGDLY